MCCERSAHEVAVEAEESAAEDPEASAEGAEGTAESVPALLFCGPVIQRSPVHSSHPPQVQTQASARSGGK